MSDGENRTDQRPALGTGQAVITPPVGCEMSGFVARKAHMQGIHDDLYARAMVWSDGTDGERVALLTLDVIELDAPTVAAIRSRVSDLAGIPGDHVVVTATHTHSGPSVMEGRLGGHVDRAYLDFLIKAAAGAVATAANSMSPVTARFSIGHEPTVAKNRRVVGGPIDPDVPILRFESSDGTVRALLVSYACHPVTLGPDNLLATADYPGFVVRTLEAMYPGAHVQFATGCSGQINTGHTAQDSIDRPSGERRTFTEAARLGRAIAGAALQASEQSARPGGLPMAIVGEANSGAGIRILRQVIDLPLIPVESPNRLREQATVWRAEAERLEHQGSTTGDALLLRGWAEWAEKTALDPSPRRSTKAEVTVLSLGEVRIAALPGEAFVELGLEIKERSGHPATMVLAYANGCPGYIPHRSAYDTGGYEVTDSHRFYGYPSGFAPEAGERLVAEALTLLSQT